MTAYRYKARTAKGAPRSGLIQAVDQDEVTRLLVRQGLTVEAISREPTQRTFKLQRRASAHALVQFYHQFAALIGAGMPLLRSLDTLVSLTADREIKTAIEEVSRSVSEGSTLADALRRHPRIFSEVAVSVIDAAESGGSIDTAMTRLADHVERAKAIRDNARSALIYPSLIVLVTLGAIIALITFVVPTFENLFTTSGVSLPLATRILLGASDVITTWWPLMVVGLLLSVLGLRTAYAVPHVRLVIDRVILKLPLFGPLVTKIAIARVSRTLASLMAAGVGILDAISSSSRTAGNKVIEEAMVKARGSVERGVDFSGSLSLYPEIPRLMSDMVGVGEQSGRLDTMLAKVADFYEHEVNAEVQGLLKVIEPALIVVIGMVLSGLVVAMYLPIFDMIATVDTNL